MNCPEHLVCDIGPITIWMYWVDTPRQYIPWYIWANLLRYQISIRYGLNKVYVLNSRGKSADRLTVFVWKLKRVLKGEK